MNGQNDTPQVPLAQGAEGAGAANGSDSGQSAQQSAQQVQQGTQQQQESGIQKRFDELTAKLYERDAQIQQLTAALTDVTTRALERQSAPQQPQAPADPFDGVDYSDAGQVTGAFKRALALQQQRFESMLQRQSAQIQAASVPAEVMAIASQFQVTDPAVIQRANQLLAGWRQQGITFPAMDAMTFAIGEAQSGRLPTYKPRQTNGQFAPYNPVVTQQGGSPVMSQPQDAYTPLPRNFDALSPDEQIRILEARGIGDKPL